MRNREQKERGLTEGEKSSEIRKENDDEFGKRKRTMKKERGH